MEHREVRRKDRKIPEEEGFALLKEGEYGVLSTITPDGLPYGVPLSYVCKGNSLYIHCAQEGLKIECIQASAQAIFVVVGKTQPVYAKNFTTYYESVMVRGIIEKVEGEEKREALVDLVKKYLPDHIHKAEASIQASWQRTAVYALRITCLTAKAKR